MTLVCGAVVYIERKLGAAPIASGILSAVVAIYARSKATAGMLDLVKSHELSPRRQQIVYWIKGSPSSVVPLVANVQH